MSASDSLANSTCASFDFLCGLITLHLAARASVDPSAIDAAEKFQQLGLDSMGAITMLRELGVVLGRTLSPTLVCEYPTPKALAHHLACAESMVPAIAIAPGEQAQSAGPHFLAQLAYWKTQLKDCQPMALPTDRPRPAVFSFQRLSFPLVIPNELTASLKRLSAEQGATLFMSLVAAWNLLLSRYSGQTDLCVGTPIAHRIRTETEPFIGCLANTLVLRTQVNLGQSFIDLLSQVRKTCLDACAHQDVPFERLVESLGLERDLSRTPLFQVMLVLQNAPLSGLFFPGLAVESLAFDRSTAKFELILSLGEADDGSLRGSLEYARDLWEPATIERLAGHWVTLLGALVASPQAALHTLPLLTEAERHQLLVTWNDTAADFPQDLCIHQLFEKQVERTPGSVALVFEDQQLSYRELNARANQLSHHLRSMGVAPDVLVALCVERSLEMVIGLLAILKAGGAYLPIDKDYPQDRISFLLQDARPAVLLTSRLVRSQLPQLGVPCFCMDELAQEIVPPADNLNPEVSSGSLAYVIYTSGSTGTPKGVCIEHRSICNLVLAQRDWLGIRPGSSVLQFASLSFDAAVWEIFITLCNGAILHLGRAEIAQNPTDLDKWLHQSQIEIALLPPAVLPWLSPDSTASLAMLVVGGDVCPPALAAKWLSGRRVLNAYGPTEATVYASIAQCSSEVLPPNIGRPIANAQIYILDAYLQPVPIGVPGEVHIGGVGLARGYLNRPELTQQKFIPNPFASHPGARLYKSGDLARFLPDGSIEFLGRIDHQVKVRGFRIELGEIESVLSTHEDVAACVVIAREDVPGDKHLCAYVVAQQGCWLDPQLLRHHLSQKLPDYMLPAAWVFLDALPLTSNGKVDRKTLPAPSQERGTDAFVPPQTTTEQLLADLFASVLHLDRVGRNDDFFALGGHSLLATQVVSRIRSKIGLELPLREIFSHPRLHSLATRIDAQFGGSPQSLEPIPVVSREAPLTLSFAQQRLWFLDQLQPGSSVYNIPVALHLYGALDLAALGRALTEILARHESLRTCFPVHDGTASQCILAAPAQMPLPLGLLRDTPQESVHAQLIRFASQEARTPFDLATGPLFRTSLLQVALDHHVLLLTMHHIVSDGWSLGVLDQELSALYSAFLGQRPSPLPPLSVQLADVSAWEHAQSTGPHFLAQLAYWQTQLKDCHPLELPTDRPRPPIFSYQGLSVPLVLPNELTAALKRLSTEHGATLFMTLVAAWNLLLSRYSGQSDLCVGTPIAHRTRTETEPLIGFFVNTLVLRTHVDLEQCFAELLSQVRKTCLDAYAHQDVPFERLVESLSVARDLSRNPLFQVMLVLQNAPLSALSLPGLAVEPLELDSFTAKFELTLSLGEEDDGSLRGSLEYARDLWEPATVERLAGHWVTLLGGLVASPQAALHTLPFLSAAERHQILVAWNDTAADFPQDQCIHQLFEEQVERTPDAVALIFEDQQLSYRELNARANQLAHHLRALGVGPEVLVALCVERSLKMVVGLLGILKAGGAYVPIDHNYPQDRIDFVLHDSHISVVVTQTALQSRFALSAASLVCIDSFDWDTASILMPSVPGSFDRTAYVIYTSGSTGTPKGVLLSHRAVANLVHDTGNRFGLGPDDVVLAISSFAFDIALSELLLPLAQGARVVIAPRHVSADGHLLAALLQRCGATFLDATPTTYHLLASVGWQGSANLQLVCTGEAMPAQVAAFISQRARLAWNGYGPSETTVWSSFWIVEPDPRRILIGRPVANTQLYILDAHLQPVPIGVPGELHIGGVGLARGYLNRPELTQQKFIPHPFSSQPGARLYKSGDVARFLPNGNIEFLGRIDHQVKVRGFRIELGEIESVLSTHAAVLACVVIAREDIPGDKRLVAYVVARPGRALDSRMLRQCLSQKLPEYMLPAAWVFLDALPLTSNGKVDRKALPASSQERGTDAFVPPQTPTEKLLADLFASVLRLDRVGRHDDFFALGGDSIISIQVTARAAKAGLRISVKQLFQNPTPARLAPLLVPIHPELPARTSALGPVPLTPIQHWLLDSQASVAHHFNQAEVLQLAPSVQPRLMEQALAVVHRHHEAFRLRFVRAASGFSQAQTDALNDFALLHRDHWGAASEAECSAQIEAYATWVQSDFALDQGPLSKLVWFAGGADRPPLLLWVIHHLVIDGVSWRILLQDLASAYLQLAAGQAVELAPVPTPFPAWAQQLHSFAQGPAAEAELSHWLDVLSAPTRIPTDHERGENTVASSITHTTVFSRAQTDAVLCAAATAVGAHAGDVLLAALSDLWATQLDGDSLRIDMESHGRDPELAEALDLSRTVGWFTSLFPVRLALRAPSVLSRLKNAKEVLRKTPRSGLGFGALRYLRSHPRLLSALAQHPPAELCFNYLGQMDLAAPEGAVETPFQFSAQSAGLAHSPLRARTYLLDINAMVVDGALQIHWTYSQARLRAQTVVSWAAKLHETVLQLVAACSQPGVGGYTPSDFPLAGLSQLELDLVLQKLAISGRGAVQDIYPLTPMQQGMLFHTLLSPESAVYYEQIVLTLRGPLQPAAMQQAWQHVLDQQPVLRTAFVMDLDAPVQVVLSDCTLPFVRHDFSALPERDAQSQLDALCLSRQQQGFSLLHAPLMRLDLVQRQDAQWNLLFAFHHALLDGWSMPRLLVQVAAAYLAHQQGSIPAPVASHSLHDYLEYLSRQDGPAAESYFRKALAGFTTPTALPGRRPQAVGLCHADKQSVQVSRRLPAPLTERLLKEARAQGWTLNSLLQAAWAVVLSRMSGTDDVVFGATVAGRPAELPQIEERLGLFINTLPVRAKLDASLSYAAFVRRLQAEQVEARSYESTPLVQVQRYSEVPAGQSLFDSVLVFESYPLDPSTLTQWAGLDLLAFAAQEMTNYALTLVVAPGPEFQLQAEYDVAQFEPGAVERMLGCLVTLLQGIADNPEARLYDLSLLTEAERHQILVQWNDTRADYPQEQCIHQLIETQVELTPDAVALVFEDQQLSYRELNARANQLAHHLRSLGVGPDALVALCVERSLEMIIGLLGILKAGGAYLPIDPYYPQDRTDFMLNDATPVVVVTQQALLSRFRDYLVPSLCLDQIDWQVPELSEGAPSVPADSLAYVIYTSGSTGRPKGVCIEHRSVGNLVTLQAAWLGIAQGTSVLQFASLGFDASVWEIFVTLCSGGILQLVRTEITQDPGQLGAWLQNRHIQVATLPPAVLPWLSPQHAGSLQTLVIAGEVCPPALASQWLGDRRVLNAYGPTENTVCASIALCSSTVLPPTIGRSIANTQLYILDSSLQPLPIGVPGELYIGGVGLARGYLNRPELTKQKFIPNPFSSQPSARLYRSGDSARFLPDGNIEFLGRIDHQVKLRGFRIELGEIESVLSTHADVSTCVVIAREDVPGDKRLCAYVVLASNSPQNPQVLRQHLAAKLPDYMLPSFYVFLDALPLTPNGKLDRKTLPAPTQHRPAAGYEAPRTPQEQSVADLFAAVLQLQQVGWSDSFFALGGHSLLAVQLVARVHRELGVKVPLRSLFQAPMVAEFTEAVFKLRDELVQVPSSSALPPLLVDETQRWQPFPLTAIQQAYWVGRGADFTLGGVATGGYVELDLRGLDLTRLEDALNRVIGRHEMLRMIIRPDGQQQILQQVARFAISVFDWADAQAEQAETAARKLRAELAGRVLPADRWPLFELQATRLPGQVVRLHVILDALLADGHSMGLLLHDIIRTYATGCMDLPPLEVSFRDYVLWQEAALASAEGKKHWQYWQQRIEDLAPGPELPLAVQPEAIGTPRHRRYEGRLEGEKWQVLKSRAARGGLTSSGLLLAAFGEALGRWSRRKRFSVNVTFFNRARVHAQIDELVGDFTSTLLVEVSLDPEATFEQRARSCQVGLAESMEHSLVSGVEVLRELTRRQGQLATAPVVFTSTLGLPESGVDPEVPGIEFLGVPHETRHTPQVWLDHQVWEQRGELRFAWDVVDGLFPEGTIETMLAGYCELLNELARSEDRWRSTELLGTPTNQLAGYAAVNATAEPTRPVLLHELVEEQAAKDPEKTAVVDARKRLSYGELVRLSRRLGRGLRELGVKRDELVAVVMDKGWEQVVGALGVLHGGGAYLPLAADLPEARRKELLVRAKVRVVLTQEQYGAGPWPAGIQVWTLGDSGCEPWFRQQDTPLPPVQTATDLAYVIFTSGSTGQPKGVAIEHHSAVNTILDVNERFGVGPQDRVLGLSALSFDLSVWDIFGVLGAGGTLVLPEPAALRDPERWTYWLREQGVTIWNSVPALLQMLVEHKGLLPQSLRLALLSGDRIPVSLPDRLRALLPSCQVVSLGGATEASIWSIAYPIEKVDPSWTSIPYGRPMRNQSFHVLDQWLQPCPTWVTGELYIGGVGLAREYYGEPERTAERFIAHPHSGERLYRTGDLGRWLPSRQIEFLGRIDNQVKLRGFRIELGEIESALVSISNVASCVVLCREDSPGDKYLCGYVVVTPGSPQNPEVLRQQLALTLPEYMLPTAFVFLASLPLTPNGKLDRNALPPPFRQRGTSSVSVHESLDFRGTKIVMGRSHSRLHTPTC